MSDLFEKLLILRTPRVGPVRYNELMGRFGTAAAAIDFLGADDALRDAVRREMDRAAELNIHYISDTDVLYPAALKDVKNHPPVITVRGNLTALQKDAVAMVGTRHATAAGMRLVADLANRFADNNYAVVSGMAIGTDTGAHRGALRASGDAVTIAVLAGGVDYIWPLENESLYHEILARGAVISEMPVGFVPVAQNFVQRNRWVAALAQQLILGEADIKSGSMTTARFAYDFGRMIYAIPSHPTDSRSVGPNTLIREGIAKLCMGVDDFFVVDKKENQNKKIEIKIEKENSILDKIGTVPVSESVLAEIVKKTISEIKSELVVLELQGLVRKVDSGYVRV